MDVVPPYDPKLMGQVESNIKNLKLSIYKCLYNANEMCDLYLCNLDMHYNQLLIHSRHGSTAFAVFFTRASNDLCSYLHDSSTFATDTDAWRKHQDRVSA